MPYGRPALASSCIWGEGERKGDWRGPSNVRDCEGEGEDWYRVGVRVRGGVAVGGAFNARAHLDGLVRRRRRSAAPHARERSGPREAEVLRGERGYVDK